MSTKAWFYPSFRFFIRSLTKASGSVNYVPPGLFPANPGRRYRLKHTEDACAKRGRTDGQSPPLLAPRFLDFTPTYASPVKGKE